MDNKLDKILAKIEKVDERLDSMDIHMAKYNKDLEFHIARTNLLEDALKPVIKHVEQMKGAGKLIFWLSVIASIAGALATLR